MGSSKWTLTRRRKLTTESDIEKHNWFSLAWLRNREFLRSHVSEITLITNEPPLGELGVAYQTQENFRLGREKWLLGHERVGVGELIFEFGARLKHET